MGLSVECRLLLDELPQEASTYEEAWRNILCEFFWQVFKRDLEVKEAFLCDQTKNGLAFFFCELLGAHERCDDLSMLLSWSIASL